MTARTKLRITTSLLRANPLAAGRAVRVAREAMARGASQKFSEFAPLLAYLLRDPPRTLVEIGSDKGGSFYAWCQIARPDALLISVDLPGFIRDLLGGCHRGDALVCQGTAAGGAHHRELS